MRGQLPEERGLEEPVPFRGPQTVQVCRGAGHGARLHGVQTGREPHPQGGPDGGQAAGDAALQHGQVRLAELGHAEHCQTCQGAAQHPQHRTEAVRQVHPGAVPGDGQRAALQAQALGQAHREGQGQLQENARLGLRRQRHHAPQESHPQERYVSLSIFLHDLLIFCYLVVALVEELMNNSSESLIYGCVKAIGQFYRLVSF